MYLYAIRWLGKISVEMRCGLNRAQFGHVTVDFRSYSRLLAVTREGFARLYSRRKSLERVTGIEPAYPAWKAGALPLSYTRTSLARLEPV
jgi:hypothetical protein